ncbi:hypothetical protein BEWA_036730 [Theileria equi strain WA]|uniref:Signal peptide containing protein n=1 Tax=Theileria equi strain WA TaxID=1537102 RepID=L1LDX0_THEEQ|nr:hypothetical protein BEWA_036730 [Theileria equi strain WA]EKX73637.1 hypothetical protein BEWA_036730 [Theileria equi strain WA]|eukprot:XP_004833089.1 hypothetical protein BEWA_036730 [Theileria equi strain WA]
MRKILFFILGISFFAADCAKKQSAPAQRVLPDLTKFGGSYLVKVEYADNVPQVTCTGKKNVKTLKLAYGGDKIWEDKSKTCKSAVVLFGLAAPQLAVLEINGENKKVYRYHDGKQWKDGNESKHKKKLEELKTEAKDHPITPQQTSKPATPAASQAPPAQQVSQQPTGAPAVQQEGAQAKPGDAPVVKGQGQAVPQTPQGQPQANAQPPVKPKEEPKATEPTNKSPAQQGSKEENKPESVPEVKQEQNPATNLQGGAKKEQDEAKEQQPAAKPVTLSERAKKVDAKSFDVRESSSNGVPLLTCTPKDKKKPTKLVYGDETIWSGNKSVLFLSALIYFKGDKPYVVTLSKKENGKDHTLFLHKDETGKWVNDKNKHAEKLKELQDAARPKESPEAVKDNVEEKVRSAPEQEVKLQQAQNIGSLPDPKSRQFKRHCKHKMHDDDDDPPTPSHDNFKVDESLFNVENGQEDGVPVLKLTAKDGTSTNKLTFDGVSLWQGRNAGDSCSVATFYLGPNNDPVGASYRFKRENDGKTVEGYRQFSDGNWSQVKKDDLTKLLEEVKQAPEMSDEDTTPIQIDLLDLKSKADSTLFDADGDYEGEFPVLRLTPKTGVTAGKLTFNGQTLWTCQGPSDACLSAIFYLGTSGPVAATYTVKGRKVFETYRKFSGGQWTSVNKEGLDELLEELKKDLGRIREHCTWEKLVKAAPDEKDGLLDTEDPSDPESKEIDRDCTETKHDDIPPDLKSKVDASLFDLESSLENDLPVLKLKAKEGTSTNKLTFDNLTVWESSDPRDSCSSATFYLRPNNDPVAALYRFYRGSDGATVEGYRKLVDGKWEILKKDDLTKFLEEVKQTSEMDDDTSQPTVEGSMPDPESRKFHRQCRPRMHDDDNPPTPSHEDFKVDESLFKAENGKDEGLNVIKLTAKDDAKPNKLTFAGKDVWKAQNDGDSCSVATFYLGPNNDLVAAKFTYKKADDKLGVGYRKHSSDGWEFIKSDAFQKLLQEVRSQQAQNIGALPDPGSRTIHKKCTPRMHDDDDPPTPSHDSFKVDESLFNVEEGQENGLRTLKLTAKDGTSTNKLTFGGFTVWEAQNGTDLCSVATFYLGQNNNPVAAKFTYKKADDKLGVGYRKHSNYKWEFIKSDAFQELLKETGETLGEFKDDCTPTKHDNPPTVEGSMPGPGSKEIKIDCTRKMHDDDNPPESGSIPDPGEIKRKCTPRQRDDNPPAVEGSMPDPESRKFHRQCKHKMHDDDDPPTPSHEDFKVDESLFKAENGKDEGLNVIKLTAKDDAKPNNLTFDGKDVWECQNGTDLCSAATFYLGPDNNPVAAKFTYKKADNKLGVGYRKLSNGKWEYIKGDTFKNLLQETKEKPREFRNDCTKNMHGDNPQLAAMPGGPSEDPMEIQRRCSKRRKPTTEAELKKKYDSLATTSTLDIHGKVDNNTTVFNKNTSDGTILMAFSSKEGHYFNNVVQGSITVWTAENGEKCTSVNHRRTKPEEIIRVFVRTPTAFKRLYYRSGDNKWTKIQRHEYFNRLKLAQNTSSPDHKPAPKHDDLDDVIHDEEADEEEEEKEQEEYADV